jgi:hypothetical protein
MSSSPELHGDTQEIIAQNHVYAVRFNDLRNGLGISWVIDGQYLIYYFFWGHACVDMLDIGHESMETSSTNDDSVQSCILIAHCRGEQRYVMAPTRQAFGYALNAQLGTTHHIRSVEVVCYEDIHRTSSLDMHLQ